MTLAVPAPVLRAKPILWPTPRGRQQRRLFCRCGQETPAVAGLCRSCYRAEAHSRSRFDGNRAAVLERDRTCRACGAGKPARGLHVHHRKPGFHHPDWLITLCAGCHARVHRLAAIRRWLPERLVELWMEQHPGTAVQLQFPISVIQPAGVAA
jgi:hypothetical protein